MNKFISIITGVAAVATMAAVPALAYGNRGLGLNAGVGASLSASATAQGAGVEAGVGAGANVSTSAKGGTTFGARISAMLTRAHDRADQEIARRLKALNDLEARIQASTNLPSDVRSNIIARIEAQITSLTALQSKVNEDSSSNSTTSLGADINSILGTYHAFAILRPQGAIEAAANRVTNVAELYAALGVKLQARISEAQASGTNMNASASALADMNTEIANATSSAAAATSEASSIDPANVTSSAAFKASIQAMQGARAKVVSAQQDLNKARQDARTVIVALIQLSGGTNAAELNANATGSATSSGQ